MADEKSTCPGVPKCLAAYEGEDDRQQAAVLRQVLEHHPDVLTRAELIREMAGASSKGFGDVDAVERAIRDLGRTGLLHLAAGEEDVVRPTRAAVRYFELTGGAY